MVAWILTLSSLAAVAWLLWDYVALGVGMVRLSADTLHLAIGRRFDVALPLGAIAHVLAPTFRDLPTPGTTQGRDFLNLTKPAAPNILIVLGAPHRIRVTMGITREVRRIALRLDDSAAFITAIDARCAAMPVRSA